jgi:hypothetical protein
MNRHPFLVSIFFDFRVALFGVFMFFILRELREYYFGGYLFFWQGSIACGTYLLTFGVIASLLLWIFAINVPGFVTKYVELMTNQLRSFPKETIEKIGNEDFEKSIAMLPSTTAGQLAALYFVQCFGIGFFISIILSVILRRQPAQG